MKQTIKIDGTAQDNGMFLALINDLIDKGFSVESECVGLVYKIKAEKVLTEIQYTVGNNVRM